LRRQRHTGKQIATEVEVSPATVSRILRRLGLNRIRNLEPAEPERRYERETLGEIIHIDIKKLGRFERVGHRIAGDRTGPNKSRGPSLVVSTAAWVPALRRVISCRAASGIREQGKQLPNYASHSAPISRMILLLPKQLICANRSKQG
jgi:hypothetical protein